MTRDQALKAFFAAVDAYMPRDDYADAAASEVLARWQASVTAAAPSDDRHLLDGVAPQSEALRQEGSALRLVSPSAPENTQ
jgi:hypothetical protein